MSGQVGNEGCPQEGKLTKDERLRILRELQTVKCFCGKKKAEGQTFCRSDYLSLPGRMRSMLYQRFGNGCEEAYTAARKWLQERANPALTRID